MKTSSLIGHVVEVLDIVLGGRRPADAVVREFFRSRHYLGSSDRRFIADRTFDILRNHRLLAARCRSAHSSGGGAAGEESVPTVMLVAAHEAVSTAGDENQLASDIGDLWGEGGITCREFIAALRSAGERAGAPDAIAVLHSVPDFVAAEWTARLGAAEAELLCAASNGSPPVSVRVNTLKGNVDDCSAALAGEGIAAAAGRLSPVALVLPKRINAQGLHSFRQGLFEMQDEGSQLLAMLLEARPGMTVLDACAGGGGKSLHIAAIMQNRGKIIALDVDRTKLENLLQRCRRAGVTIVTAAVVTESGPPPVSVPIDAVLVDAPCSGTGTFRRNPWAKRLCTEEFSSSLARRQAALLERYAPVVRHAGRLVYTTCTLLKRENQDVVEAFLIAHPEYSLVSAGDILLRQGIRCPVGAIMLELFPHRTGTDGFFAAVMARS